MTFSKTIFFFKEITIVCTFTSIFFLFLTFNHHRKSSIFSHVSTASASASANATTAHHLVFAIASSSKTFPKRKDYIRLWYRPNSTRAYVFLDRPPPNASDPTLPPVLIHESTARFPYKNAKGHRSAIALARIAKAVAMRNESDVRWYVFGDDDTVFFVENIVRTLSKYDHEEWYYIGSNSESYEQNAYFSFDMGYGGGGFVLSHGLAKVLATVLDSCIMRYPHLYGSDARIFSCLAELGVGLTHEPGFHQVDLHGNIFGLLSTHPQTPLLSLHHLDGIQPLFPDMSQLQSLQHLFAASNVDSARLAQQTVCYDPNYSLSVSISWGFAIQLYQGNVALPELLSAPRTFDPWDGDKKHPRFMFKTRPVPGDPCRRPVVFYLDDIDANGTSIWTSYTRRKQITCPLRTSLILDLEQINVFSNKLDVDTRQVKVPRRQCCDILSYLGNSMSIRIRHCGIDELTSMYA